MSRTLRGNEQMTVRTAVQNAISRRANAEIGHSAALFRRFLCNDNELKPETETLQDALRV